MFYRNSPAFPGRRDSPGRDTGGSAGTVPVERGTGGDGGAVGLAGQDLRHHCGPAQGEHDAQGHGDDQADHVVPPPDLVYWRVTMTTPAGQSYKNRTGSRPDSAADNE